MKEGGLIELTGGPSGGENYADGWWEGAFMPDGCKRGHHISDGCALAGLDTTGKKGIFPSNYVRTLRLAVQETRAEFI